MAKIASLKTILLECALGGIVRMREDGWSWGRLVYIDCWNGSFFCFFVHCMLSSDKDSPKGDRFFLYGGCEIYCLESEMKLSCKLDGISGEGELGVRKVTWRPDGFGGAQMMGVSGGGGSFLSEKPN